MSRPLPGPPGATPPGAWRRGRQGGRLATGAVGAAWGCSARGPGGEDGREGGRRGALSTDGPITPPVNLAVLISIGSRFRGNRPPSNGRHCQVRCVTRPPDMCYQSNRCAGTHTHTHTSEWSDELTLSSHHGKLFIKITLDKSSIARPPCRLLLPPALLNCRLIVSGRQGGFFPLLLPPGVEIQINRVDRCPYSTDLFGAGGRHRRLDLSGRSSTTHASFPERAVVLKDAAPASSLTAY